MSRNNSVKIILAIAVVAAVAAFVVRSQDKSKTAVKPASEAFPDAVVARGKGIEITRRQLDNEFARIKGQVAMAGQTIPPEHTQMLERNILDQMIALQIFRQLATPADKAAAKEVADKRMAEARERLGSDEVITMRLKAEGLTKEELLEKWTDQAIAEAIVKRELKSNVTDEQVRKFYEENPARFEEAERVRAAHVLIGTRDPKTQQELSADEKAAKKKTAEEVLKRAKAGEDFAALAKEFSEDPGSKDKGGEYTFPKGQMVPEFEAAAFSMQPGQISDIVTTDFGYHIIKLYEKLPAKKVELASVSEKLKDALTQQEIQKQVPAYMSKLRKDLGIEILDPNLKLPEAEASGAMGGVSAPAATPGAGAGSSR